MAIMEMLRGLVSRSLLLIYLVWDLTVSFILLFIGRLLPDIKVTNANLQGKTCIVTGANSGIGHEIALQLAKCGATVYLACRNTEKGEKAASDIIDTVPDSSGRVKVLKLDTSSIQSVKDFASTWLSLDRAIDILVHNAGITDGSGKDVTDEGLGTIYCTNFLGSFILTSLLEENLNNGGRVISTTSTGQYGGSLARLFVLPKGAPSQKNNWLGFARPRDSSLYADTKLMQVAFTALLQERWDRMYPARGLTANCFTPGYTNTPIFDKTATLPWYVDPVYWFLKAAVFIATPVQQGAAGGVWLATVSENEIRSAGANRRVLMRGRTNITGGGYWDRCSRRTTLVDVESQILGTGRLERCWDLWEKDAGLSWDRRS